MINVDVWADVRCPWCWIGLRRLQRAADLIETEVTLRRRSFLLEPQGPANPGRPMAQVATGEWQMSEEQWDAKRQIIESEGESEGLTIALNSALTFDSNPLHRLLKLAAESLGDQGAEAAWDAAFAAHFERNENLGDPVVLREMAAQWGLDDSEVGLALSGERFTEEVATDIEEARRISVVSVPTVTASDDRRISGSVSADELAQFLLPAGAVR